MTRAVLTDAEWREAVYDFRHSAFRLELQPDYREPGETDLADAWLAGQEVDPESDPGLADWFAHVRAFTSAGGRIARVRVHEDPPTDYQRWERWLGRWNTAAGEDVRYLTRAKAHEIGLLPTADALEDWWLHDEDRLIVMRFIGGRRVQNELITDRTLVARALAWRDLAVRHGVPDDRHADHR